MFVWTTWQETGVTVCCHMVEKSSICILITSMKVFCISIDTGVAFAIWITVSA